jgi:hypothetical protein
MRPPLETEEKLHIAFGVVYFAVLRAQPPLTRAIAVNFWGNFLWTFFVIVLPT